MPISADRPAPVDGGWSEWGAWSECSRTCGAGISIVERRCDDPEPANGGRFCIGKRRRYKICNSEPCPEGAPSFRRLQCSNYDGREYKGKRYTWLPYFDQSSYFLFPITDSGFFSALNDFFHRRALRALLHRHRRERDSSVGRGCPRRDALQRGHERHVHCRDMSSKF